MEEAVPASPSFCSTEQVEFFFISLLKAVLVSAPESVDESIRAC